MLDLLIAILLIVIPPCQTEDSTMCYWDADMMGNGRGHSFIALP